MKYFLELLMIVGMIALTAILYFCINFVLILFNTPHDAKLIAEILSGIYFLNLASNCHIEKMEVPAE